MSKPFVIGITGGSGSGKTTFIKKLRGMFTADEVCILSQDDYYLPREQQHVDENGEKNFDLPKSFDKKAFKKDLEILLAGETVTKQEYTFNNPNVTPKMLTFKSAPVLVIEGLFVFHFKKIAPLIDFKVFINTKETLKVIRRIHRDQVERGYPISDVLYKYENHVLPSYERYIEPYRDAADIVINNNEKEETEQVFDMQLAMLAAYIRTKLT